MGLIGFVDNISSDMCVGWVLDSTDPDAHVDVEVWAADGTVAIGIANQFRDDLLIAGHGDGCHAFSIPLTDLIGFRDPEKARIRVLCRSRAGNRTELRQTTASNAANLLRAPVYPLLSTEEPIFILGAARSGTSAMYSALVSAGIATGEGEGHFFPVLTALHAVVDEYYRSQSHSIKEGTLIGSVSPQLVFTTLCEGIRPMMRGLFKGQRWVDKTPTVAMVEAAPLLAKLWPGAKFLFMKRRGIENVLSRTRKFPNMDFAAMCNDWKTVMTRWSVIRGALAHCAIEIEQSEMQEHPACIAQRLGEFLGLSELQEERLRISLSSSTVEVTGVHRSQPIALAETGWTAEQQEIFLKCCSDAMSLFSYGVVND